MKFLALTAALLLSAAPSASIAAEQGAQPETTRDADALSKARAIGTKIRKVKKFYEPQFDISGLESYKPQQQVSGTIRQWGNNYIKDSGLVDVWEAEFRKHQPGIQFSDNLYSSAVGFPGLVANVADLAPMGRQALWDELKGFEREGAGGGDDGASSTELVEIVMATGSFDVRGWTYALGFFVNKDNPLASLSMEQLDGIFGARRDGGWDGLTWRTDWARGPEKNIRTWGQLGLKGKWADKPIHVYGYNAKYHFQDEIDKKVLKGSSKWNEDLRAYSNITGLKKDGSLTAGGELIMNAVAADPYGIGYTGMPFAQPGGKVLALSTGKGAPVPLTLKTVQDRSYPLLRDVYYYVKKQKGKPIDPKVKEFLRYVLSREGQAAVQADGKYLPLTPEAAKEQLAKLDAID
ncbi:substrate-binding domain-containing protein [Novosphingobium resinovorum]|uniref:Phosphate ABC transporter substrate-binding protein n=1 Tax=Novosphingobium resinovorum TaxID=158500 RepID=A0A031JQW8_9SPHN|nr:MULTISPECIES: substrate-binding domain-containing protein [Sphingomonadaceae]AOR79616.1 phosphate ABC transporter substrate-binding protein [Novosphingobium resinovorum]EJU13891.1 phosphate ABC transporter substrate-binding protein [Sphingomonas sp. LH128]EZP79289.1 Phosphate ABC transporter substrate-binding protein [Novosphingobium resinovorum]MBF7013439.1 substrate-binding domain-containing protein [Novosphingobium sp. HR1a]WJM25590.1 substrate-binding domain-containing protein [Novosphi